MSLHQQYLTYRTSASWHSTQTFSDQIHFVTAISCCPEAQVGHKELHHFRYSGAGLGQGLCPCLSSQDSTEKKLGCVACSIQFPYTTPLKFYWKAHDYLACWHVNAVSTLSCLGFALIKTWTQCIWSQLKSWTTYTGRDFRGPWSWPYSFHTLVCGPFPGSLSLPTALSSALYTEIKLASLSYDHSTLHTQPQTTPNRGPMIACRLAAPFSWAFAIK